LTNIKGESGLRRKDCILCCDETAIIDCHGRDCAERRRSQKKLAASSQRVILVRKSAATEDIAGVATAAGLPTATGGRTSHIAGG